MKRVSTIRLVVAAVAGLLAAAPAQAQPAASADALNRCALEIDKMMVGEWTGIALFRDPSGLMQLNPANNFRVVESRPGVLEFRTLDGDVVMQTLDYSVSNPARTHREGERMVSERLVRTASCDAAGTVRRHVQVHAVEGENGTTETRVENRGGTVHVVILRPGPEPELARVLAMFHTARK